MWATILTLLLSQVVPETPAGWAGWASFATSGGVLVWLLFWHLPAKDKQLKEMLEDSAKRIEAKDAFILLLINAHLANEKEQRLTHVEIERAQRAEFKETLQEMVEHSRRQVEGLSAALKADIEGLQKAVEALTRAVDNMVSEPFRGRKQQ